MYVHASIERLAARARALIAEHADLEKPLPASGVCQGRVRVPKRIPSPGQRAGAAEPPPPAFPPLFRYGVAMPAR